MGSMLEEGMVGGGMSDVEVRRKEKLKFRWFFLRPRKFFSQKKTVTVSRLALNPHRIISHHAFLFSNITGSRVTTTNAKSANSTRSSPDTSESAAEIGAGSCCWDHNYVIIPLSWELDSPKLVDKLWLAFL